MVGHRLPPPAHVRRPVDGMILVLDGRLAAGLFGVKERPRLAHLIDQVHGLGLPVPLVRPRPPKFGAVVTQLVIRRPSAPSERLVKIEGCAEYGAEVYERSERGVEI